MILASSGIIASSISGVDADWLAYYNRVIAAGGSLTTTEQNATKQLVADLKANSLWTPMKAIYPMVGASAAACAQNLKSSSFTGTFTSGWTFASSGVTPNGTSAYMNTGLNANTSLNVNSSHISYYRNIYGSTEGVLIGINDLSLFLQPTSAAFYGSLATIDLSQLLGNYATTGFFMINRPSNSIQKLIKNNNILQTDSKSSVGYAGAQNIFLGNYNSGSTFASNSRCALATIGDGLTDTQASNFYTAVQAFQTTLSRNV